MHQITATTMTLVYGYHEEALALGARTCVMIEHVSSTIAGKTGRPEGHQKSEKHDNLGQKKNNLPSLMCQRILQSKAAAKVAGQALK